MVNIINNKKQIRTKLIKLTKEIGPLNNTAT